MKRSPIGAVVALHLDAIESISVGDLVESRNGRRYTVIGCRVQLRGKHMGRQHLQCMVVAPGWMPENPLPGAKLHRFDWYRR